MTKGCHSCRWAKGPYCEHPSGGCNWVGELFRGEPNDWINWRQKLWASPVQTTRKPSLSQDLRRIADLLDKEECK